MLSFVIAEEDLRIETSYPFNEVTAVFLLNNPRYHYTLTYEIILQWKIGKLQPESPLAQVIFSVEWCTTCYIDSAGFCWNQLYALRIHFCLISRYKPQCLYYTIIHVYKP